MKKIVCLWLSSISCFPLQAQQKTNFTRIFQFSLTPAISTNGMHPGGFSNYFSMNLTSGYSAANYLFEVGGISNLNEKETRGLQIAGIANLTGANVFAGLQWKEVDKKKREGFEANLAGAQLSGLTNIVLNNVFGWQTSGGVNLAKGALQGFQLAGISNIVYKYSFGVQLAGLYNVSAESMDGVQFAGLFNITKGGLYGVQIAAFNRAGSIEGINSFENSDPTGLQLGIVNLASTMNGFQIGLVNYSKRMQGTQVGLINIFHAGRTPETRDGSAIGLFNLGTSGFFSVYASDMFPINVEIATGSIKNGRISGDRNYKYIQNSLIWSKDFLSENRPWAIGYGLKKFFFNRSLSPGMNRFHFFSVGVDWMHINHGKKFTNELSLLSRPTVAVGSKLHPRNKICYLFVAASYSVYRSASGVPVSAVLERGESAKTQHWPGFSVGALVQ